MSGWLKQAAAPRWTVLFFLLTAAAALGVAQGALPATRLMAAPFALLILNLGAAIVTNGRFRGDLPLLIFHLALIALVGLLVLARLTYLDATVSLTRGTLFEGELERVERGPFHWGRIEALRFANQGLVDRYSEKGNYEGTYNRVSWLDAEGSWENGEIGDDRPLVLDGYRIYATSERGLAPLFQWKSTDGQAELGAVQLSDHRGRVDVPPAAAGKLPGGREVWVQIHFKELPLPRRRQQDLGASELAHSLVLRTGDTRQEIKVGDSVEFPEGRLTYIRLDSWIGYRIVYDPTTPWTIATLIVGISSLIWFYLVRIWGRPVVDESA